MGLMPARKNLDYLDCSVANALDVIGDRWSLLILRDAFLGVRRFDHWQRDLGIARNILAQRLDRLVEAEVLETRRYQDNPPRDEYVLTAKGKDLLDVLLTLWRWGDRWAPPPEDDASRSDPSRMRTRDPRGPELRALRRRVEALRTCASSRDWTS